jgi:hypothetical protein
MEPRNVVLTMLHNTKLGAPVSRLVRCGTRHFAHAHGHTRATGYRKTPAISRCEDYSHAAERLTLERTHGRNSANVRAECYRIIPLARRAEEDSQAYDQRLANAADSANTRSEHVIVDAVLLCYKTGPCGCSTEQ